MPSSDDINSAFGDQWGLLFTVQYSLGLVLYGLGLPSGFLSCYYTIWDCLLVSVLSTILVWDCFPFSVLYCFRTGSVSSRECPTTVFKKL